MKTIHFTVGLVLAVAGRAFSQEPVPAGKPGLTGGFGHGSFTARFIDFGALNAALSAQNYATLNPVQFAAGGGGNFVVRDFMFGGEGATIISSAVSNASNSVTFTGGYGQLNLGYILYKSQRSIFYPMLGIGGGGYSLLVRQKNPGGSFDNQIQAPSGGSQLDAGGFLLNVQLAFQRFFCGRNKEGFMLGIKAGYYYSPSAWTMRMSGEELHDAPRLNMNGPYVTLFIGGGSLANR
jgi:hypothetical protein